MQGINPETYNSMQVNWFLCLVLHIFRSRTIREYKLLPQILMYVEHCVFTVCCGMIYLIHPWLIKIMQSKFNPSLEEAAHFFQQAFSDS